MRSSIVNMFVMMVMMVMVLKLLSSCCHFDKSLFFKCERMLLLMRMMLILMSMVWLSWHNMLWLWLLMIICVNMVIIGMTIVIFWPIRRFLMSRRWLICLKIDFWRRDLIFWFYFSWSRYPIVLSYFKW